MFSSLSLKKNNLKTKPSILQRWLKNVFTLHFEVDWWRIFLTKAHPSAPATKSFCFVQAFFLDLGWLKESEAYRSMGKKPANQWVDH